MGLWHGAHRAQSPPEGAPVTSPWRNGDHVRSPLGASGTVVAVRKGYIMVQWDELTLKKFPNMVEFTQVGHDNSLEKINAA